MNVEELLFDLADALRYPVLVLAIAALAMAIVEAGALLAELHRRRGRSVGRLEWIVEDVRAALGAGDLSGAERAVRRAGFDRRMADVLAAIVQYRFDADARNRIAKRLAEYDYGSLKRLERTRILVRLGPALGLMGTLIPLSPALAGLAKGDVAQLTRDLRVAFSVTVVGLLVGGIAFAISLVRDRLYAQDYSDVEFVAAKLAQPLPQSAGAEIDEAIAT